MDFTLSAAPYPNAHLAFCGAMALQSFLASRKVREAGGLRPNLYLLALAGSGTGKAFPRKVNSYVLGRIGMGKHVGNQIASGQALEDKVVDYYKMLFQTDEIDHLLRCVAAPKESHYSMLLAMLLQLYTAADEIHVARAKANQHKQQPRQVDQPGLVIFGTATPECFFDALSPTLLTNGLFSRAIVVDAAQRKRNRASKDVSEIPQAILEQAAWWRDYNPAPLDPLARRPANLNDVHPQPAVVPYSDDGRASLERFADRADEAYNHAQQQGDRIQAVLWTRAAENATRLALVYAVSRQRTEPLIDRQSAEWAVRFVEHMLKRMLYLAASHVAENPFHAQCLKLLAKLRQVGGQMERRKLMRSLHWKAKDFDEVVATLVEQGDLVCTQVATKTKPAVGYRLP